MRTDETSTFAASGDSDGVTEGREESRGILILVEVEVKKPPVRLKFESSQVTGREIKERADVPLDNDLARRRGQKLDLVTNEETITISNGDRFVSLPPGTIS